MTTWKLNTYAWVAWINSHLYKQPLCIKQIKKPLSQANDDKATYAKTV